MDINNLKLTNAQLKLLEKLDLKSIEDILTFYPFRYDAIEDIPFCNWQINDKVCFEGFICSNVQTSFYAKNKSYCKFNVESQDNTFSCTVFNRPWAKSLKVGQKIFIMGKYENYNNVSIIQYNLNSLSEQIGISAIYSMKEKMSQKMIYKIMDSVFKQYYGYIENIIPNSLMIKYQLLDRKDALRCIHFPKSQNEIKLALRTLKYEEFLKFNMSLQLMKSKNTIQIGCTKVFDEFKIRQLIDSQPFDLTNDQLNTIDEIVKDSKSEKSMYRLILGDVGCGKTIVAAVGMYLNFLANKQSALMVPTEILAKQHLESLLEIFDGYGIKIKCLYSALSESEKRKIKDELANNNIDIIVGTHSLIQDDVTFSNLGIVVADEQHRFGVNQRKKLIEKGKNIDFLLMSATPIPRTLANTIYGDMDVSIIKSMPKNRLSVITKLIKKNSLITIVDDLKQHLINNDQIYVICASIEDSENFKARSVIEIRQQLGQVFNDYNVEMLHGKMSSVEKDLIMDDFRMNKINVLVSTTVIEVGVNVKNANVMVIYDAHRFGMSQIHQLRGRIVRGNKQGICYLLTSSSDKDTLNRLSICEKCSDGFELSMQDLKFRGAGDILGTRQSGLPSFILGDLFNDSKIIEISKQDCTIIMSNLDDLENMQFVDYISNKMNEINKYID